MLLGGPLPLRGLRLVVHEVRTARGWVRELLPAERQQGGGGRRLLEGREGRGRRQDDGGWRGVHPCMCCVSV
jgi:hypothetical protein